MRIILDGPDVSVTGSARCQQGGGRVLVHPGVIKIKLGEPFRLKIALKSACKLLPANYCQFLEDTVFKQVQEKI